MNKKLIVSNIFLILIMICTSVYAAINANLNLTSNKTSLKAGDEFTVTLSLKDLTGITSGVDSIQGYINIDENILEKISFDSIVKDSNDKIIIGSQEVKAYDVNTLDSIEEYGLFFNDTVSGNDYKIVLDLKNKVKTEDLVSIKFKVKSNVKAGDYSDVIKYEMFNLTEGVIGQSADLSESLGIKVITSTNTNTNKNTNIKNNVVNKNTAINNSVSNTNTKNNVVNKNTATNNNVSNTNTKNNVVNKNTAGNTNKNTNVKNTATNKSNTKNNTVVVKNTKDNSIINKIIPAAGEGNTIVLKLLTVVAIVGFVIYAKFKKYKEI